MVQRMAPKTWRYCASKRLIVARMVVMCPVNAHESGTVLVEQVCHSPDCDGLLHLGMRVQRRLLKGGCVRFTANLPENPAVLWRQIMR
jgi:hypothetical protein